MYNEIQIPKQKLETNDLCHEMYLNWGIFEG
jgi:hypothetical protein